MLTGLKWIKCKHTLLIAAPFFCAYAPHSMKTTPSRLLLSHCTTASVNTSQPLSLWELAWCARTVSTALRSSTPGEPTAGLLKCSCVSSFNRLHLFKKYPVRPIQSDLHDQGAENLQCLRPVLCTCSPNWQNKKAWKRWWEKTLLDWFQF